MYVWYIVPEKILSQPPGLSPSQHFMHIVKILVNCWHNLTNHASGYNTIQPVQLRLVLADRCMPNISLEFVFYFYLGMPNNIVDIPLPVMSTHTGKATVFMHAFPKCLHFEKNKTLFRYFRVFCYKYQKHATAGLLGPVCVLTYVRIYESLIYNTYILGDKL